MDLPRLLVSYEYRILEFECYTVDELNALGFRAWELVCLINEGLPPPPGRARGIFKRRVVTLPEVRPPRC